MFSLIEVIDARELTNKKKIFNDYLQTTPIGEIPPLEKAYFQILYDLYIMSGMKNENEYSEYKMTNIVSVYIKKNKELNQNYFRVLFTNEDIIDIGYNELICI